MSRSLLPFASLFPAALGAVVDLPLRFSNGYAVVDLDVGTPPVPHSFHIDTGSATTWLVTASCAASADLCPNNSGAVRTGYSPSNTSSSSLNTSASIGYLGGQVTGTGQQDTFSIPSSSNSSSSLAWPQTFLAANRSSWFNIPADGFLGLAFNTISDAGTTTLVETLLRDGLLDMPRFGLYYGTNTRDGAGEGVLTLGGSREAEYAVAEGANLTWAGLAMPGDNAQLWRVDMQYLVASTTTTAATNSSSDDGEKEAVTIPASGAWGVFDTGAGRIAVPDPYIDALYEGIGMNWTAVLEGDVIPLCEDFTDAWSVEFNFGDWMHPATITLTGDMLRTPGFASGEDKYCWPPFDASGSTGLFLFGKDFLEQFYTVFDYGAADPLEYQARIGFGALKDEFKPVPS